MGHARRGDLDDIADVLSGIRALPGVSERSPGIFYFGRPPFLHFHVADGARWADARAGRAWGPEIPLPFGADAHAKAAFLGAVRARHAEFLKSASTPARSRRRAVPGRR
jgi:hypothetical protein